MQTDQPGYAGGPPQDGYDARPTSVAAIVGLIGAFVFWPVGLVASIIGIGHTKPGRKKGRGLAIAGLIVSIVAAIGSIITISLIVAVASSPEVQQSTTELSQQLDAASQGAAVSAGDASGDVVIDSCEAGEFGLLTASATITNSTDAAASYLVTGSANDAEGNRVAELSGAANSIAPGQSAQVDLIGSLDEAPEGMQCVVANVSRYAS